jgi:hypothetical protein
MHRTNIWPECTPERFRVTRTQATLLTERQNPNLQCIYRSRGKGLADHIRANQLAFANGAARE